MNEQQPTPTVSEETVQKPKKRLSQKWRLGTVAAVTTAIVVAVILLLNLVMDTLEKRYPLTLDLTSDGTYTLSQDSIDLAKGVQNEVEIVVFLDENIFISGNTGSDVLDTVLTQFYNTLQQYQAVSGGKVTYRFVDLDSSPTLAATYQDYNIKSGSILFLCGDRYQVISYQDLYSYDANYYEASMSYSSEVERVVAAKINLVSAAVTKKVTLLTGHGENAEVLADIEKVLNNNGCEVEQVDITASAQPSEESSVLVIPGATSDYSADEIAQLRKWIDNDGKREVDLMVLVSYQSRLPNLYEMLNDEYGVEVLDEIVCETDAANVYAQNPYYAYGDIASTDFTADLTEVRVLMPYTRAMKVHTTESTDESMYAKKLVTFGETAKVQPLSATLGEEGAPTGVESLEKADEYPVVGAAYVTDRLYDNNDKTYYTTDVMVFGTELFVYSSVIEKVASAYNEDVFLNTFRGLTGLESVISVSSRSLSQDTLDFGGSLVPKVLGIYVFTIGIPLVLIVLAIVVFVKRRRL